MSEYRRWRVEGGTYFFTVVTHRRRPWFLQECHRTRLRLAIEQVKQRRSFEVFAIVLLLDHLHTVWTLPPGDADYSTRWRQIKTLFTQSFFNDGFREAPVSSERKQRSEHGVWQRRFFEHTIRDDDDLKRCVDYLHFNPVKHRLVSHVRDWPWSSFHRFVQVGDYEPGWGRGVELSNDDVEFFE